MTPTDKLPEWHDLMAAIDDCYEQLSTLTGTLLPFDGPTDDRINYTEAFELFVLASAMTTESFTLLASLMTTAINRKIWHPL